MSWMENRVESDVQTAIQSQSIQTAVEANTSKITDAGFTSYLQNAPIPRMLLVLQADQSIAATTTTTIVWNQVGRIHDPYSMLSGTSTIQIPVGGYYTFVLSVLFDVVGNFSGRFSTFTTVASKRLGAATTMLQTFHGDGAGETTNQGNVNATLLAPFDAGDSFTVSCSHNGGAGININDGSWISGVWNAPYNTYQTAGGN